jgi:predicted GNAT superfamily acetyltransferase
MGSGENADSLRVVAVATRDQCEVAGKVFDAVWQMPSMVPTETIIATLHAGGYASIAMIGENAVGASWGFLARHGNRLGLHSHVTGVLATHANSGVGLAVKHHQWWWARERGLDYVTWTFDPLVRRNAYFNLVKLGVTITEYHEDFYGEIADGINRGQHTDRVFVEWPVHGHVAPPTGSVVAAAEWSVATPVDIEALRRDDRKAADEWRQRQRADLRTVFDGEWRISGLMADGSYAVIGARR